MKMNNQKIMSEEMSVESVEKFFTSHEGSDNEKNFRWGELS